MNDLLKLYLKQELSTKYLEWLKNCMLRIWLKEIWN